LKKSAKGFLLEVAAMADERFRNASSAPMPAKVRTRLFLVKGDL
jgi:hypothetical protein